jgi:hypothetical protein
MSVYEPPVWESQTSEYVLKIHEEFAKDAIARIPDYGTAKFQETDEVLNITDDLIAALISEGAEKKWFAKLPTQEQLLKKVSHTFATLATADQNAARPVLLRLNPKKVTIVWQPEARSAPPAPPPLAFEDSEPEESEDSGSEEGPEPEIAESNLPAVALRESGFAVTRSRGDREEVEMTREQYLLTRLRAAKARLEAEQIRMQYFEATGQMPPDSDSEEDSEGDF